jgi:hypothetical protein
MDDELAPDGAGALCDAGCCVGTCATSCCWAGKGLVGTTGEGFLVCSTNFWTLARHGQSRVKWYSYLQAKHGNFTFFFPFLFLPGGDSLGLASSCSHDFLNDPFLSDEAILEVMTLGERPWEDNHHRSSILPPLDDEDPPLTSMATKDGLTRSPSTSYGISTEENLSNISKTITIDISIKPSIMEAITIGAKSTQ